MMQESLSNYKLSVNVCVCVCMSECVYKVEVVFVDGFEWSIMCV